MQARQQTYLGQQTQEAALTTIAAHIGSLNERALLAPCIAHLRQIGVSQFVVCDVGSTDGSRDDLARLAAEDFRVLLFDPDGDHADLMQLAQDEAAKSPADWVLLLDPDEFPLPRSGDITEAFAQAPAEAQILHLPRYNVVLGPEGPRLPLPPGQAYEEIDLFVAEGSDPATAWLSTVPDPKIALRPGATAGLTTGGHGAQARPGETLTEAPCPDILIAHLALSDFPRFERKIANIRQTVAAHGDSLPDTAAWHWRRWLDLAEQGALAAEYENSRLSAADLAAARAQGRVKSAAACLGLCPGPSMHAPRRPVPRIGETA